MAELYADLTDCPAGRTMVSTMSDRYPDWLRPIERRVLRLQAEGHDAAEIGRMFRRSAEHIDRIIAFTELPGRTGEAADTGTLRPVERCVLRWRRQGADHAEIGERFGRSARHIRQVEGLALFKQSRELLSR